MTWYMFSCSLSLFRNEPESQYSECKLTCGQRLFLILKKDILENAFLKPEYPFKFTMGMTFLNCTFKQQLCHEIYITLTNASS